jgi:uncharacterized protein DUF397
MEDLQFRTSSYTGTEYRCVEVAAGDGMFLRDSKDQSGAVLGPFSAADWAGFLAEVKAS